MGAILYYHMIHYSMITHDNDNLRNVNHDNDKDNILT